MNHKKILIQSFSDHRWFIMQQLRDLALDHGEVSEAAGWGWLLENRKYPNTLYPFGFRWVFHDSNAFCHYRLPTVAFAPMYYSGGLRRIKDDGITLSKAAVVIGSLLRQGKIPKLYPKNRKIEKSP